MIVRSVSIMRAVSLLVLFTIVVLAGAYPPSPYMMVGSLSGSNPLPAKLSGLPVSVYPGFMDFMYAAYSPLDSTWIIPVGAGNTLNITWTHNHNCSKYAYPLYSYNGQPWNTVCQPGYGYEDTSNAFISGYAANGITVPAVVYTYYPHVITSVSGNFTKLILASYTGNRTIAVVPTCAYQMLQSDTILLSEWQNGEDTVWSAQYQALKPGDSFYLGALASPFSGGSCLQDGEVCWPSFCDSDSD